jgi:hypothetical protein|eukprot:COSAG01_NODE_7929_length_2988_cov_1.796816_1_plen_43_part_00
MASSAAAAIGSYRTVVQASFVAVVVVETCAVATHPLVHLGSP